MLVMVTLVKKVTSFVIIRPGYKPCSVAAGLVKDWSANAVRLEVNNNWGTRLFVTTNRLFVAAASTCIRLVAMRYLKPPTSSRVSPVKNVPTAGGVEATAVNVSASGSTGNGRASARGFGPVQNSKIE